MGILARLFGISPDHPGVYRIRNRHNGKVYVGSTGRTIRIRIQEHIENLNASTHHNHLLQEDWDRCGGQRAFSFEVMEVVKATDQVEVRERYWQLRIPEGKSYVLQLARPSRRRIKSGYFVPVNCEYTDNMEVPQLIYVLAWTKFGDGSHAFDVDKIVNLHRRRGRPDIDEAVRVVVASSLRKPQPSLVPVPRDWLIGLLAVQRYKETPDPYPLPPR